MGAIDNQLDRFAYGRRPKVESLVNILDAKITNEAPMRAEDFEEHGTVLICFVNGLAACPKSGWFRYHY